VEGRSGEQQDMTKTSRNVVTHPFERD